MTENQERIEALHGDLQKLRAEMKSLLKQSMPVDSSKYRFASAEGDVSLRDLFGEKEDLILIHNMGMDCPYCTTYADGIGGILQHLEDRSAVALLSPDAVQEQKDFAFSRGWKFRMISSHDHGEAFNTDMGFYVAEGEMVGIMPGFSCFHREGEVITRTGFSYFDPGDDFCVLFPMMALLKDGQGSWQPQYDYSS